MMGDCRSCSRAADAARDTEVQSIASRIVRIALTRTVPPTIGNCELTHLAREPIDYTRAVAEHHAYERALAQLGCRVERLPDAPRLPDSVFVEDTAVVLDSAAMIARSGAESRRPEAAPVADTLKPYREVIVMQPPGTLDGGDVLRIGARLYVGRSTRTNDGGIRQLATLAARDGITVITVPVTRCLHLKTAVTAVRQAPPVVLVNRDWIDTQPFDGCEIVDVDPAEPGAANVLLIGETVVCAAEFPRTRARLDARGIRTIAVASGELAKAEGALTCCSIVFEERPHGPKLERP
jgi:dimethylargininase